MLLRQAARFGWSLAAALACLFMARNANADAPAAPPTQPPPPETRTLFVADPIVDGSVLALGGGWAILSSMIISTGEIRPQQIDPSFKTKNLLSIDRVAVTQTLDPHAGMNSNIGLGVAVAYAAIDPVLSGVREKSTRTALIDGMIYLEALAVTDGATSLSKLAVRRPRPIAYIDFEKHKNDPNYENPSTDSALSFVSGHASTVGAVAGTATYLGFARSPHSWRPWATLIGGVALTSFVSVERVRAGAHFPTDVIAGSLAGGAIGVMTAHLHRDETTKSKPMWVGWQPSPTKNGGALTINGLF